MIRRFLPLLVTLFLLADVARAWMGEWIYPLDESSLWRAPSYPNPFEEIERIELSRRFAPRDPRYAYRLTRLYSKVISEGSLDPSLREQTVTQVVRDFQQGIKDRPLFPEYLAGLALFLQSAVERGKALPDPFQGRDPVLLADEKVKQALFLGHPDHHIRWFAATYYQYRGWHRRSIELWRSILIEDPTQTAAILERCFNYYQDPSFLLELAPQEKTEALIYFQKVLIGSQPKGWGEKVYLKTLPLLIESEEKVKGNAALLEVIARTYEAAEEYREASLWYEKAFRFAKTPDSQALLLLARVDVLLRQGRRMEARSLLKKNLSLSSVRKEILVQYAEISRQLGEREETIKVSG